MNLMANTRWSRNVVMAGLLVVLVGLAPGAVAQGLDLGGKWSSQLGVLRISQDGLNITGKLIWVSPKCPFDKGEVVLEGVLLEDSLSGKFAYCLKGDKCSGTEFAPVVMLAASGGKVLSGAAHYKKGQCQIGGKGKGDGLVLRRLKKRETPAIKPPKGKPKTWKDIVDDDGERLEEEVQPLSKKQFKANQDSWRKVMEEGDSQMQAGLFERARKQFLAASKLDPTRPEAFNGIGVTYYARNDYEEALNWYKKALETDSNFGDAYYNMACIYSLMKKKDLAFRYLDIALLNGFIEVQAMQGDPDLNNVREDPRYEEFLAKMKAKH